MHRLRPQCIHTVFLPIARMACELGEEGGHDRGTDVLRMGVGTSAHECAQQPAAADSEADADEQHSKHWANVCSFAAGSSLGHGAAEA